jgi:RNA recognition motif-containing protein
VNKKRLFFGGLLWGMDSDGLKILIEEGDADSGTEGCGTGTVEAVTVAKERETNRSRGFGFVTMITVEKAQEAIRKFNGLKYKHRTLKVDEATDQSNRRDDTRASRGNTGNYANARGFSNYSKDEREY